MKTIITDMLAIIADDNATTQEVQAAGLTIAEAMEAEHETLAKVRAIMGRLTYHSMAPHYAEICLDIQDLLNAERRDDEGA